MKKANIVLDNQSTGLTIIERMDFADIDIVFDVLHDVFHPVGLGDDGCPDPRFLSLWTLFLVSVGWTEDEYWEEWESHRHKCHDCGKEMDSEGNHVDKKDEANKDIPPESKPN